MIDNTCIREIDSYYLHNFCDFVTWQYHTGRTSLKIAEIDEWIDTVHYSILLDAQLDNLHAKIDEAQAAFDACLDSQRKVEDEIGIFGAWRRIVDDL